MKAARAGALALSALAWALIAPVDALALQCAAGTFEFYPGGGFHMPEQQMAIGMGCEIGHARRLVYADGLDLADTAGQTPIGVNCRLCERVDCNQRAVPPLNRRLAINETFRGFVPFTFAEL